MKKIILSTLAFTSLLSGADEVKNPLITHTELSYIQTSGNTQTESFAAEVALKKSIDAHKLRLNADAYYSKEKQNDGVTRESKNKWSAKGNYDYDITKTIAFNYVAEFKRDKFSGFNNQLNTGPGLVVHAIKNDAHVLDLQANVLYSRDDLDMVPNKIEEYSSALAALDYSWQIVESLKFIQTADYKTSLDDTQNYFVLSKTAVENKINDTFSMGVSYKVDYKNKKQAQYYSDNTLLVSLIIDY